MENKTTLKIWVTKGNFALIQEGTYPKEFMTSPPNNITNHVEMIISIDMLKQWESQQGNSKKYSKGFLFG